LVCHGEAAAADHDPRRPLKEGGRAAADRVATRAAAAGVLLDRVWHSDAARAQETAAILAERLGAADRMEAWPEVGEGARDVAAVERRLRAAVGAQAAVALVGHQPLLGRLAAHLVTGDEDIEAVKFTPGALVRFVARESGVGFAVAWALAPELA
jgi:phosphohistidine phosphatase SixA